MLLAKARQYIFSETGKRTLSLMLLFAFEAYSVQRYAMYNGEGDTHTHLHVRLFLLDIAVAGILVLTNRTVLILATVFQFVSSLLILTYVSAIGEIPTLSALVNGYELFEDTGTSPFSYVSPVVFCILLLSAFLKLFLIYKYKLLPFKSRLKILLCPLVLFALLFGYEQARGRLLINLQPEPGTFSNPVNSHIRRQGFLPVWAQELIRDIPGQQKLFVQEIPCDKLAVANIPLVGKSKHIILLQVESLDYDVIGYRVDGELVAPNLTALAGSSALFQLEGKKKLASSNSDYEILTGNLAEQNICYYQYLPSFKRSIVEPLKKNDFRTVAVHGLQKEYMNLGKAYTKLGFGELYFRDKLEDAGYMRNANLFMQHVPDADVLNYASQDLINNINHPSLHLIITVSMHGENEKRFRTHQNWPAHLDAVNYFDEGLGNFVKTLPEDALLIIYGDHNSYGNFSKTKTVPLIIYQKGKALKTPEGNWPVFTRCEISDYLRRIFLDCAEDVKFN